MTALTPGVIMAPAPGRARQTLAKLAKTARHHPGFVVGLTFIVVSLLAALLLPLPDNPTAPHPAATLLAPSGSHLMGTDENGFDEFSRVIAAARVDIPIALAGALLAALIGVPLGLLASAGTRSSGVIVRGLDIFQSFPLIVLALVVAALAGDKTQYIIVAIMLVNVPQFIRLVRSEALVVRSQRFVEAARAVGASPRRITFRHVLPNVTATIFAQLSLSVGNGIIVLAALSFVGVGIAPPTPSWGAMIFDGSQYIATGQWWLTLFPGLAILVFVVSFNAVADGLEALLRPE